MLKAKGWAIATGLVVALAGAAFVIPGSQSAAQDKVVLEKDHWHHHDGHWSYWNQDDKTWYYTDGSNWFYQDGDAWKTYRFDRKFGREGFERGEYRVPAEDAKIVVPTHKVFRPR